MMQRNICPVCGFEMEVPPSDYNICSSCGTEFGHDYTNADMPALRAAWIQTGPAWWSKYNLAPSGWNGMDQLMQGIYINPSISTRQSINVGALGGVATSTYAHVRARKRKAARRLLPNLKINKYKGIEAAA